ncbi:hypothetical protein D3C85_110380 [compost metagenome]
MKFLIRKKYINRHRILETLQSHYEEHWNPNCDEIDISLSFTGLTKHSKLSEQEVREQLPYLKSEKEIDYFEIEYSSYYIISDNGKVNLYDKKHYYVGRKMFYEEIYDMVKNISAILLLIIAIITFANNLIDTKNNKKELENLKTEIKNIKALRTKR